MMSVTSSIEFAKKNAQSPPARGNKQREGLTWPVHVDRGRAKAE
jgi:hypothetical protein